MPQTTNRSLIGQMAASPTGPGTVYSAMLKARATNQERVSRVNESENMRLTKVKNVMDRNSRHAQWQSDQQMEEVRRSLMKLHAFRRVLHEDVPVDKLIRCRPKGNNPRSDLTEKSHVCQIEKQKEVDSLSNTDDPCMQIRMDTKKEENNVNINHYDSRSSKEVNLRTSPGERKNSLSMRNINGDQGSKRVSFFKNENIEAESTMRSNDIPKVNQNCVTHPRKTSGNRSTPRSSQPSSTSTTNQPKESASQDRPQDGDYVTRLQHKSMTSSVQTIETRRDERRRKLEEKIVCRGFDMNTLKREVTRKMRAMDPKRKRKQDQIEMASCSRRENERIIADSRSKFMTVVMTTSNDVTNSLSDNCEHGDELEVEAPNKDTVKMGRQPDTHGPVIIDDHPTEHTVVLNPLLHRIPLA